MILFFDLEVLACLPGGENTSALVIQCRVSAMREARAGPVGTSRKGVSPLGARAWRGGRCPAKAARNLSLKGYAGVF